MAELAGMRRRTLPNSHAPSLKVKELLSTKDNIPDKLEAIFAASIKIDNTRWENKENRPKKAPTKVPSHCDHFHNHHHALGPIIRGP
ncbi:hypothetical protein RHS01_09972 [Rhizoctonia solani]|uniref:Uncharacterized protein n=1 Tax=Rhizoctonia solani TaxID=456999 RepID=A0A8H7I2R2_9AGAM|nr:hypothetical protein RHS01_09972 [Rhizoctonia solani]